MLKRILKRNLRQPLFSLAVLLFAGVLTVVLCWLHRSGQEEQASFEEAYASVPVFFKVTDLDGSRVNAYGGIDGWVAELFTRPVLQPSLVPYVKEIHSRTTFPDNSYWGTMYTFVTGITSTLVAEELTSAWGGAIYWNEGYDESVLTQNEFVCLVPEQYRDETEITIRFCHSYGTDAPLYKEITKTFRVAGYYVCPGNTRFYVPFLTVEWLHSQVEAAKQLEELGAILNDNSALDGLREAVSKWFAEPNPEGSPTIWDRFGYEYYFYAMDIDDGRLQSLAADMENSIRMNRLASAAVFVLSAGAGFLTGFLVIRSRKREISLMRTVGASQASIFLELALEQVVCILAGILLGGGYSLWQPIGQLCLFGGIYCVGLTAALLLFLRSNLLAVMKEDE